MSEIENKPPRAFKKRYIAVAALSALAIAGGAIGATITAQSTIKDNQITVQENNDPVVVASGAPMKVTWAQGTNGLDGTVQGKTEITLKNNGKSDASVRVGDIGSDVFLASAEDNPISGSKANFTLEASAVPYYRHDLILNNHSQLKDITLKVGEEKKFSLQTNLVQKVAAIYAKDLKFDIPFEYIPVGGAWDKAVTTADSTVKNNAINVTAPKADVTATGAPMDVVWDTASTPATEATYTLKNDGGAAATVKLLPIEGVEVDAGPSTQVYLRGYLNGAGNPIFDQDVQKGASAPRPSQEFTLEPGATATVKMLFGKQGPGAPAVYEKTFDLKFDFVTKK